MHQPNVGVHDADVGHDGTQVGPGLQTGCREAIVTLSRWLRNTDGATAALRLAQGWPAALHEEAPCS